MKKYLLIICNLCFLSIEAYSQDMLTMFLNTKAEEAKSIVPFSRKYVAVGTSYQLGLPIGNMTTGMSPVHSLHLSGALPLNFITPNLQMGLDAAYGIYGLKNFGIKYNQANNYINTTINYTSDVAQAGLFANYVFFANRKIQPFVTARFGYMALSSRFYVADPLDPDACRVLENETLQSDGTLYWGYGMGFRWNVCTNTEKNKHFIEFSVMQTMGNPIDYVNVSHLQNHTAPIAPTNDTKPIDVTFINPGNQNLHQHRIGELYNNPLNLLQFKIGYTVYLRLK